MLGLTLDLDRRLILTRRVAVGRILACTLYVGRVRESCGTRCKEERRGDKKSKGERRAARGFASARVLPSRRQGASLLLPSLPVPLLTPSILTRPGWSTRLLQREP